VVVVAVPVRRMTIGLTQEEEEALAATLKF
jgi:hypothetical protein